MPAHHTDHNRSRPHGRQKDEKAAKGQKKVPAQTGHREISQSPVTTRSKSRNRR
jgi:hypothetical protein